VYWLQVKDNNNCTGKDTIVVNPKDCMKGFYIPSAFTPNGDGRNDIFRPMLFGNVKRYQFAVYNRWGEVIYLTTELSKGWNGKFDSSTQDTNVFVWSCTFQLEGEEIKTEKGTVVLIR
jgi:gliding motility-associated-like protein